MNRWKWGIGLCFLILLDNTLARADFVFFNAAQDNTLYESQTGALSNGAGDFLFAGRIAPRGGSLLRRGLIRFDISTVASGSNVSSATLRLGMNKSDRVGASTVSLHRLTRAWGEGTSNADNDEGGGIATTAGDASWTQAVSPGTNWTTPGGDFVATASASLLLNADGNYTWGSNAGMVSDVQLWINNPASNFGWIILGDESSATTATAMRFLSRTGPITATADRPLLTIDVAAIPEPASSVLVLSSIGWLALRRRAARRRVEQLSSIAQTTIG